MRLVVIILLSFVFKITFSQDSPDYSFEFIDNKIVVLEYNSIYDVHVSPDTINYPNQRIQPGGFDNDKILSDLKNIVNPKGYDFVLLYSLHEIPGWINSGPRYSYPAKNIGQRNDMIDNHWEPAGWENLKSVPHMNSIEFLFRTAPGRPRYGSSLTIFHEIDHYWGVYINDQPIGPREWTPDNPVAWLASASSHWTWVWVNEDMPGIMYSGPTSNKFNEFDLYFMGLMSYDDIKNVTYEVYEYMPETCGHDYVPGCQPTHELNMDSIIYAISLKGTDFSEGNGQRIPATDTSIQSLNVLNVIVKGKDETLSNGMKDSVLNLLDYIPQDWELATWNRSRMEITIETTTNIVSIPEKEGFIKLYPNPTDGQVNLLSENISDKLEIYIYSESGRCVFVRQYTPVGNKISEKLDLSGYPPGIYFIKVLYDNQIRTNKLILTN